MAKERDVYAEIPAVQPTLHHESVQAVHQPVVVAIDVSGSMKYTESGQTKTNIQLAEEMVNQIGQDPDLSDKYKRTVDFCVMSFADHITTEFDWAPLSHYKGGIHLTAAGRTAFHDVVKQSLNAVRVMRRSYYDKDIECKRPQIFIITDGYSTDPEDNPSVVKEAKQLCEKYVDTKYAAIHVILLPGGKPGDITGLSDKIMLYKVDDCAYGLPAIKTFINASLVAVVSSIVGDKPEVELPDALKTARPIKQNSDGTRTVTEEVLDGVVFH